MTYKIQMIGEIGWEITPDSILEDLASANGSDIEINFSSIGGSISKGLIIASMLKDYRNDFPTAKMTLNIKSEASSMASHIAALPIWDKVTVEETSIHMIHNPQGVAMGDYQEMQSAADFLKRYADVMAIEYSRKSGISKNQIKKEMDSTTFRFGKEIVDSGFADEVLSSDKSVEKDEAISMVQTKYKAIMKKIRDEEVSSKEFNMVSKMISMSENFDAEMPYPNEHAARIIDPAKFQQSTFRRKNIADGIDIIIGKLENEDSMTAQAYRFDKTKFTVDHAKKWLKDNNVEYISFEPATNKPKESNDNNMQKPAKSGENNNQEEVNMTAEELKKANPDTFAGIEMAGVDKGKADMIANNKAIMDLKNKPEYKELVFIQERCDEAIMKGESIADLKMSVMALMFDPKNQASLESPGNINGGGETTMSGEGGKPEPAKVTW